METDDSAPAAAATPMTMDETLLAQPAEATDDGAAAASATPAAAAAASSVLPTADLQVERILKRRQLGDETQYRSDTGIGTGVEGCRSGARSRAKRTTLTSPPLSVRCSFPLSPQRSLVRPFDCDMGVLRRPVLARRVGHPPDGRVRRGRQRRIHHGGWRLGGGRADRGGGGGGSVQLYHGTADGRRNGSDAGGGGGGGAASGQGGRSHQRSPSDFRETRPPAQAGAGGRRSVWPESEPWRCSLD